LHEGKNHDEARDRVLRAYILVVAPNQLFLALAKHSNHASEEACYQEWEWNDSNVIDREKHTSCAIDVSFPAIWATADAYTVIDVKAGTATLANTRLLCVTELARCIFASNANEVCLVLRKWRRIQWALSVALACIKESPFVSAIARHALIHSSLAVGAGTDTLFALAIDGCVAFGTLFDTVFIEEDRELAARVTLSALLRVTFAVKAWCFASGTGK